jgi:DNA adenine methylase
VALSGYDCALMDELYGDWRRVESEERVIHSVKATRREVLWINYELEGKVECPPSAPQESRRQASLL